MNKWLISALAMGACLSASASAPSMGQRLEDIERIGAQILGQQLGMDPTQILGTSQKYNRSVYDLAPMFSLQHYSHRSSDEIWRLRQSGMGWGNIAKRLGMNPGEFNKMRVRGEFDDNWRWDDVMRQRYHWSDKDIRSRRGRGQSWATLVQEGERSHRSGTRTTANQHGHRDDARSNNGSHKGWTKGKGNPHDSGQPIGHGNGRSHGNNDVGKAKGHDKNVGQGKGHAGGNGKGHGGGGDTHGQSGEVHGKGGGHGNGHGGGHGG